MSSILFALLAFSGESTPLDLERLGNVEIKKGFMYGDKNNGFPSFDREAFEEDGVRFKFGKMFIAFTGNVEHTASPSRPEEREKLAERDAQAEEDKNPDGQKSVDRVDGIKVGRAFTHLHVVHATQYQTKTGEVIAWYTLNYKDGEKRRFAVQYGRHLVDWWVSEHELGDKLKKGDVFWEGKNDATSQYGQRTRLYKSKFTNPRPEVEVTSIDIERAEGPCLPFVFAMSVD